MSYKTYLTRIFHHVLKIGNISLAAKKSLIRFSPCLIITACFEREILIGFKAAGSFWPKAYLNDTSRAKSAENAEAGQKSRSKPKDGEVCGLKYASKCRYRHLNPSVIPNPARQHFSDDENAYQITHGEKCGLKIQVVANLKLLLFNKLKNYPRCDSNAQPLASEANALSIELRGRKEASSNMPETAYKSSILILRGQVFDRGDNHNYY